MINNDNVIYCKECETQLWSGDGDYVPAYFPCHACGVLITNTITGREYLQLQQSRKDRQAQLKAEAQRKRRNAASRGRYAAMKSLGMVKTPYGWE